MSTALVVASSSSSSTALAVMPPSKEKKRKRVVEKLPLRQPHLAGSEAADMEQRRQDMLANEYTPDTAPILDERIPDELIPLETWVRPRRPPAAAGVDRYWLCHLCNEAALLRDPRIFKKPYYTDMSGKVAPCPPGFVSKLDLEKHMRAQHCLPIEQPPADLPRITDESGGAAAAASTSASACTGGSDGGGGGGGGGSSSTSTALALARPSHYTNRQWEKIQREAREAEEAKQGEAPAGALWGDPGTGDGVTELHVQQVNRVGAARFEVMWQRYDRETNQWMDDVKADNFGPVEIKVLRRTAQGNMLPGLDDAGMADTQEDDAEAPANDDADNMGAQEEADAAE